MNVKLDKSGGMLEAYRMLQIAKALGMKTMLGCMISSSVTVTAAAHLSPLVDYADLDGNLLISNDPFHGVRVEKGKLVLPDKPGLGTDAGVRVALSCVSDGRPRRHRSAILKLSAHRVIILGGGFGGLYAARELGHAPVDVTIIDRRNFHLFQPLLYQVATGSLSPGEISAPIRGILSRNRIHGFCSERRTDIDPQREADHPHATGRVSNTTR